MVLHSVMSVMYSNPLYIHCAGIHINLFVMYLNLKWCGKWFEPRDLSYLFGVIVQVRVVFRKTVVGD